MMESSASNIVSTGEHDFGRVLLVSAGHPENKGVGEQFVASMVSSVSAKNIYRYALHNNANEQDSETNWIGGPAYLRHHQTSPVPGLASLSLWKNSRSKLPRFHAEIAKVIDRENIQAVWFILNSPTVIRLAAKFANSKTVPYACMVWDCPEYLAKNGRLDPVSRQQILADFDAAIGNCDKVASISDSMGKIYQKKYGIDFETMSFCPPAEVWAEQKPLTETCGDEIELVFGGSLYAWKEWEALLNAIELRNNGTLPPETVSTDNHDQSGGKANSFAGASRINVTCMGIQSRRTKKRDWVNYVGHQAQAKASEIVQRADIAYLPYWLDAKFRYFTQTAFPSKLPFYISAGLPIFYHGPKQSTPNEFFAEYPLGQSCSSIEPKEILAAIDRCSHDKTFRENYLSSRMRAFQGCFNPDRNARLFSRVVSDIQQAASSPLH